MKRTFFFSVVFLIVWACKPETEHQHPGTEPASAQATTTLMLNDTQAQLANITTQKVTLGTMGPAIVANGRIAANQQRSEVISSRAGGRIEKLYVKETGRLVRKGAPLYELYSETLLTLQQEYLVAREQAALAPRYASLAIASEKKLLRYGLTQAQIENLARQKTAAARITFVAPASGLVTEIQATE
jgi:Cu(I)/Ag(I) efflux system membrane fusion protein